MSNTIRKRGNHLSQIFESIGYDIQAVPPQEAIILGNQKNESLKADGEECFVSIVNGDINYKIGPCPYPLRGAAGLPAKGNRALVITSDENEPWIVAWWPYE
jgi:hypothetical protein